MPSHLVHLVCGSTGAGKTTYALKLSERVGGIAFSIDQLMATLYWMDSPQPLNPSWSLGRVERCSRQIWAVAQAAAARNVPCVLDLGFSTKADRAHVVGLARGAGLPLQLHFLDVSAEERWRRVETRNRDNGPTHQLQFQVTREMFDFVEGRWEPPSDAEMAACDGIRITS